MNLGFVFALTGDVARARRTYEDIGRDAGDASPPLRRLAAGNAALALAGLAGGEGLAGEPEVARQHGLAMRHGRASGLLEGELVALQSSVALGGQCEAAGRHAEAIAHFREAIAIAADCELEQALRHVVSAQLQLGQELAEAGDRAAAAELLTAAWTAGRRSEDASVRGHAAMAVCWLHRQLCALDRWDAARALAVDAEAFARTLDSPVGRALLAAVRYGRAIGQLNDGDEAGARGSLREAVALGLSGDEELGSRVVVDALLTGGRLDHQAGRCEDAPSAFRQALDLVRGRHAPDADAMAAMAAASAGHCLLSLERWSEAGAAFEEALARGRASGVPTGRAAAAAGALHIGVLASDELPLAKRREFFRIAIALGRSSGTPMGVDCAAAAEEALRNFGGSRGPAAA